jgi:glutaredoxin
MDGMSQGRCATHDLACGPDGQCALCHRASSSPPASAGTERLIVTAIGVLCLLVAVAFAWRGLRGAAAATGDRSRSAQAAGDGAPQNPVRLYTASWCPHCKHAKAWLKAQHIDYAELDVESDPWARREHRRLNPRGSVPVFDAYGEVVQGFSPEAFQAALARGAPHGGGP